MTKFKKIVPVLKVADLPQAVDFYTCTLGFRLCWRAANDAGGENCMLQAGAADLLLSTGSHLGDKPQFTGTLYFHMDDVEEYYDRIKKKAQVLWPLDVMEYGQKEFGIRDCNGYTLAFAEEVEA